MGISKECKEMLDRIKEKAGDDVIYDIDVISLVVGTYGDKHEIYEAMTKGKEISKLVESSIGRGSNKFLDVLKARLYMLCVNREKELADERQ